MTPGRRQIRTTIRYILAAGVLLFAWYAVSRVHAGAPEAPLVVAIAAAALLVLSLRAWRHA